MSQTKSQTPFCSYCKSIGKSVNEYTTHYAHKTLNKNSRFTCPELLARVCNNCPNYNHTYDRCPKRHRTIEAPKQSATKQVHQSVAKTKFDCLYDSSDDESEATDKSESAPTTESAPNSTFFVDYTTEQFKNQPIEDQKDQLGEYIYRIIVTTHPEKAGKYTGCLLDLEVDHLIYIIETPSEMNEMLIRLVESNI